MKKSSSLLGIIGFAVLYALSVFLCAFIGFLHPVCWVGFPVLAAFLGAYSYYKVASRTKCFGVGVLLAAVLAITLLALREICLPAAGIMLAAGLASDIVRQVMGNKQSKALFCAYPVLSAGVMGWLHPLWTDNQWYHEGAIKEMGADYAEGLMTLSSPLFLCLFVVLTLIAGYIGIRIVEKKC